MRLLDDEDDYDEENEVSVNYGESFLYPDVCDTFDIDMDSFIDVEISKRITCAAHQFQRLLIYGTFRGMDMSGFGKVRTLIRKFKKSDANAELHRRGKKTLKAACTTRWGYWIHVLENFRDVATVIFLIIF